MGAQAMPTAQEKQEQIRIGVDLGGTKIEFVALEREWQGAAPPPHSPRHA